MVEKTLTFELENLRHIFHELVFISGYMAHDDLRTHNITELIKFIEKELYG